MRSGFLSLVLGLVSAGLIACTRSPRLVEDLVVCANDQTVTYATRVMTFREEQKPGSVAVINLATEPPSIQSLESIPSSVIGPPTSIARVPGQPLLLVSNAMRAEKSGGVWKHGPDRTLTLVKFGPDGKLEPVSTIEVGSQPSGLCVTPDGQRAYVANRADGTVSVVEIGAESLKEKQTITLAEPADSLAHIELSPDGRHAIATLQQADTLLLLKVDSRGSLRTVQRVPTRKGPYAARFTPDGSTVIVAHIGSNSVTFYKLKDDSIEFAQEIPVGNVPEGLNISPDGEWITVNCMEGSSIVDKASALYGKRAQIYFLRKTNDGYRLAETLPVDGAPQFAVFSPSGKYLVISHTQLQVLSVYKIEKGHFIDTGCRIPMNGEPIAAGR